MSLRPYQQQAITDLPTAPSENWRSIPGYEGIYEVSDQGRVRSLDRFDKSGAFRKGRVLAHGVGSAGRHEVVLYLDGKRKQRLVHRLVLEAFVGPCPYGQEGCHDDGDPNNNSLTNLRWDTHASNMGDRVRHKTLAKGEKHGMSKLRREDALRIRAMCDHGGLTHAAIAEKFGIHRSMVGKIANGKYWRGEV